jgi:multiple sugar transport system substrate-binding protein
MKRALQVLIFVSLIMISIIIYYLSHDYESADSVKKIYFADNISAAHQTLIDKFNLEYQGRIEVYPVNLPFSKFSTNERKELLARSLRSKSDRIDVFAVDLIWVPRFSRWAEPLDAYLPAEQKASIIPNAIQSCYFNGHLFGFPFYIDVGLMYYRQDLLHQIPDNQYWEKRIQASLTWNEMLALAGYLHSLQGFGL